MDPDRVRSYLQVACAGLGFDIGEVWWMSNESGTSSVAAIEERGNEHDNNHNESDSSGEGTYANLMSNAPLSSSSSSSPSSPMEGKKNRGPKKRFLQLYTSKAYCNQRSKLVQPHDNPNETSTNDGHDEDGNNADMNGSDSGGNSNSAALGPLVLRNNNSNNNNTHNAITNINNNDNSILDEDEHVLSPRIVEAVTLSAQVVWANCQKQEGLLGRSDIKLQTAIGMPVGVDDTGNVWVVVMFSPKNVESTSDAIDYLQYISRSAASCSIPCLLPVIHHPGLDGGGATIPGGATKMICDGSESEDKEEKDDGNANGNHHGQQSQQQHHHQSLVPIQSKIQPVDHTQELGEGVIAQFVSFRLNDEDENDASLSAGMDMDLAMSTPTLTSKRSPLVAVPEHDLRNAPKDDFGIPMLPDAAQVGNNGEGSATMNNNQGNNSQHHILTTQMQQQQNQQQQQQQQQQQTILFDSVSDAFDEASYGVWSTIMNSASGDTIRTSGAIASKMHLIQERLEEFANAFLGMSVFDVADAWITSISSPEATNSTDIGDGIVVCHATPKLKCLFTVAANEMNNENVHLFREVSANASIEFGDGAVGKAFSSGYPVWSSNKELIYDKSRKESLQNCNIRTVFAVPIFSAGDVSPSCVLSCYSLLPTESVPFVLNFVQKAVRLLWDGLDRVVNPHESVGMELWKDVGPADLGEMAADLEMQKAFIGKKRTFSDISPGQFATVDAPEPPSRPDSAFNQMGSYLLSDDLNASGRDRSSSYATQINVLPSLAPSPSYITTPVNAPPGKGLGPAPVLPTTVQQRRPTTQQFVVLNPENDGYWAVQQAVRSVGNVAEWHSGNNIGQNSSGNNGYIPQYSADGASQQQEQQQVQQQQLQQHNQNPPIIPNEQQQPQFQPEYEYQMDANGNYFLSYANYGGSTSPTTWIDPSQQVTAPLPQAVNPPPPQALYQPPGAISQPLRAHALKQPPGVYTEDPVVVRANIMEFNAMAQMHSDDAVPYSDGGAQYTSSQSAAPTHNDELGTVNEIMDIQLSQTEGSNIWTGHQQEMFGTATAQPVVSMDIHMVNTSGKECRIEGCRDMAVVKRPYCFRHCGNRQCEREGCNKCAQGATRFCIAHGGGRRCTFPGCDKGARDKFFCAAHGGGKRCKLGGCSKSAVGGSSFCTSHGGGRRCQVEGCDKSAQSSTCFCVKHGGGKKCQHEGCEKVSRGRTMYCAAHGGGVRCKLEGCNRVAIGKAQLCRAHGGGANSHLNDAMQSPFL